MPALSQDEIASSGKSGPSNAEVRDTVQRRPGYPARAFNTMLRVSRRLADRESAENIEYRHIGEAVQYR